MPRLDCPHCGEPMLTISNWATARHCPNCGRRLLAADGSEKAGLARASAGVIGEARRIARRRRRLGGGSGPRAPKPAR